MCRNAFYLTRISLLALMLSALPFSHLRAQAPRSQAADPFGAPADAAPRIPGDVRPPPEASKAATGRRRASPPASARERIEQELQRTTDLDVVEMPLKDVTIFLQEKHNIPIVLSIKKLEEASVSPDTPVTKTLRNITLAAALDLLLKDLELEYYVGEVLVITTPHDAASQTELRTYDCRSLLRVDGNTAAEHAERAARLMQTIQSAVDSDSWRGSANGMAALGTHTGRRPPPLPAMGVITEFDGLLVVTQTAKTHRKIQQVLNKLCEATGIAPIMGKLAE